MLASSFSRVPTLVLLVLLPGVAAAQSGTIAGRILEKTSKAPVAGASVEISTPQARSRLTQTGADGAYRFADVAPGRYTVFARRLGQGSGTAENVMVRAGETVNVDISIARFAQELSGMTVTGVARQEKVLDAPQEETVIRQQAVERRAALTSTDHLREATGVHIASGGLVQSNVVARGFNNIFSGSMLTLTDNRFSSVPSLRVNVPYLVPTTNEDIERIEVVLGPAAALYGPNSAAGVLHIITKSPFTSEGTTVTIGAGERSVVRGGIRHAQVINDKVAFKISGDWMTGNDWRYVDPAEPPTTTRDYAVKRWAGEARVDVRPDAKTEWITSFGRVNAGSAIELTGTSGAAQVKDWSYSSAQTRIRRGRLFAQVFGNFSDAGDTRLIRTNSPIVDQSRLYVAQLQHGTSLFRRVDLTYGGDYQRTDPRTGGTINGRNEDDDKVTEFGGYLHTVTKLTDKVDFVAAARIDHNDRVSEDVFSPRAALVFKPREDQNFRVTYNRAFTQPSNFNLFLDLPSGSISLGPLGTYRVVALGVPKDGLHFRRDCNGLCMRTPLAAVPGGQATPGTFMEADATLRWRSAIEIAIAQNPQLAFLRTLPPPTKASVRSNLAVLNPTSRAFGLVNASDVKDIEGLSPSKTSTFEAGYKGLIADRLRLSLSAWYEDRRNFVGPSLVETPNVFLDEATTAQYLSQFPLPPGTAQAVAAGLAKIPLGTISPDHPLTNASGSDIIVTYRNYGKLSVWGSDASAELMLTSRYSVLGNFSWINKDLFPRAEVGGLSDVTLNSARRIGSATVRYRDDQRQWGWDLRSRLVAGFPVQSGVYNGQVDPYELIDANVDVKLPTTANVFLSLTAQNILDKKHREFVGVPEIGRFIMTQLRYTF